MSTFSIFLIHKLFIQIDSNDFANASAESPQDFFSTFKILMRQKEHRKDICKENPMAMLNSIFGKKDGYCH